jgi:hypothetical protein
VLSPAAATFLVWFIDLWLATDGVDGVISAPTVFVILAAPLIAGLSYGVFLMVKRHAASSLAVILGPVIGAIAFILLIYVPAMSQSD